MVLTCSSFSPDRTGHDSVCMEYLSHPQNGQSGTNPPSAEQNISNGWSWKYLGVLVYSLSIFPLEPPQTAPARTRLYFRYLEVTSVGKAVGIIGSRLKDDGGVVPGMLRFC